MGEMGLVTQMELEMRQELVVVVAGVVVVRTCSKTEM